MRTLAKREKKCKQWHDEPIKFSLSDLKRPPPIQALDAPRVKKHFPCILVLLHWQLHKNTVLQTADRGAVPREHASAWITCNWAKLCIPNIQTDFQADFYLQYFFILFLPPTNADGSFYVEIRIAKNVVHCLKFWPINLFFSKGQMRKHFFMFLKPFDSSIHRQKTFFRLNSF